MNNTPLCINLYAGPGAGKSTTAAFVYAHLKTNHINCELITEYAKRKVWENNTQCLENQFYITAKQQYMMWTVSKHVDVLITDSPLLLGCIYSNDDLLSSLIVREYKKFNNIDIFLRRNPNVLYQSNGRIQSKDEAIEKDNEIISLLSKVNPSFLTFDVDDLLINNITHASKLLP